MEVATARARLDEPVVLLADLIRGEPLTAGESVQLADALLAAPHGRSQLSVRSVVVTESGSIRLLEPVPDLQACGRLLATALGVAHDPRRELAAVERAAPALVACIRSLAAGKPKPMELPTIEGRTLVQRLNNVGLNCRVPLLLLAP